MSKIEDDLEEKGYSIYSSDLDQDAAKELCENLRSKGYKARSVKYATRVRGYHKYAVWSK